LETEKSTKKTKCETTVEQKVFQNSSEQHSYQLKQLFTNEQSNKRNLIHKRW